MTDSLFLLQSIDFQQGGTGFVLGLGHETKYFSIGAVFMVLLTRGLASGGLPGFPLLRPPLPALDIFLQAPCSLQLALLPLLLPFVCEKGHFLFKNTKLVTVTKTLALCSVNHYTTPTKATKSWPEFGTGI
jgi:hypothetical protein